MALLATVLMTETGLYHSTWLHNRTIHGSDSSRPRYFRPLLSGIARRAHRVYRHTLARRYSRRRCRLLSLFSVRTPGPLSSPEQVIGENIYIPTLLNQFWTMVGTRLGYSCAKCASKWLATSRHLTRMFSVNVITW